MAKYNPPFALNYQLPINHCSWSIQNQLIQICADYSISLIVNEIKECKFFSIMCDEAR